MKEKLGNSNNEEKSKNKDFKLLQKKNKSYNNDILVNNSFDITENLKNDFKILPLNKKNDCLNIIKDNIFDKRRSLVKEFDNQINTVLEKKKNQEINSSVEKNIKINSNFNSEPIKINLAGIIDSTRSEFHTSNKLDNLSNRSNIYLLDPKENQNQDLKINLIKVDSKLQKYTISEKNLESNKYHSAKDINYNKIYEKNIKNNNDIFFKKDLSYCYEENKEKISQEENLNKQINTEKIIVSEYKRNDSNMNFLSDSNKKIKEFDLNMNYEKQKINLDYDKIEELDEFNSKLNIIKLKNKNSINNSFNEMENYSSYYSSHNSRKKRKKKIMNKSEIYDDKKNQNRKNSDKKEIINVCYNCKKIIDNNQFYELNQVLINEKIGKFKSFSNIEIENTENLFIRSQSTDSSSPEKNFFGDKNIIKYKNVANKYLKSNEIKKFEKENINNKINIFNNFNIVNINKKNKSIDFSKFKNKINTNLNFNKILLNNISSEKQKYRNSLLETNYLNVLNKENGNLKNEKGKLVEENKNPDIIYSIENNKEERNKKFNRCEGFISRRKINSIKENKINKELDNQNEFLIENLNSFNNLINFKDNNLNLNIKISKFDEIKTDNDNREGKNIFGYIKKVSKKIRKKISKENFLENKNSIKKHILNSKGSDCNQKILIDDENINHKLKTNQKNLFVILNKNINNNKKLEGNLSKKDRGVYNRSKSSKNIINFSNILTKSESNLFQNIKSNFDFVKCNIIKKFSKTIIKEKNKLRDTLIRDNLDSEQHISNFNIFNRFIQKDLNVSNQEKKITVNSILFRLERIFKNIKKENF